LSAPHTHAHPHSHDHDPEGSTLGEMDVRVRALETLLTQKGYVDPAALDRIIETYETKIGPHNGARVVARAWTDPDFHAWLLKDATAAIASFGFTHGPPVSLQPGELKIAISRPSRSASAAAPASTAASSAAPARSAAGRRWRSASSIVPQNSSRWTCRRITC